MQPLANAAGWALGDPLYVRTIVQLDLFSVDGTEGPEGKFNCTQKLKEVLVPALEGTYELASKQPRKTGCL